MQTKTKYQDEWLAKALKYYQIIDQKFIDELTLRYPDEPFFFDVLIKNDYLTPEDIATFIESALKIPVVNLEQREIPEDLLKRIPEEVCRKNLIIPFESTGNSISIASFNPSNLDAENEIEYLTGKYVKTFFAYKAQILLKIGEHYAPEQLIDSLVDKKQSASRVQIPGEELADNQTSVVKLVNQIFSGSINDEASDIHIEPQETSVSVRYRIDGVLKNIMEIPRAVHPTVMSRIKILSNLNIAETRKPQDGKAKIIVDDFDIDLRISILPTNYGEKAVIRILDRRNASVSFEQMGIRGRNKELLEHCFTVKQGMVLVTGPTGSGKSTTLYSALNRIRSNTNNILTIEDPIEYRLEGINQVQVNEKAGITFATALRSFLRQDPDVILVGEIRDRETAEIAIQAALTGHLVLSTLHTNDTFTTITRMQDMGIDKFKITESLQAIVAQRLVRRLCEKCRKPVDEANVDGKLMQLFNQLQLDVHVHEAAGCEQCGYTGYKGRIGVYEILILDDEVRDVITGDSSIKNIRSTARKNGFRNLFEDGLSLIAAGITDYKELIRVIHPGSGQPEIERAAAPAATEEVVVPKSPEAAKPSATDKQGDVEEMVVVEEKKDFTSIAKDILVIDDSTHARQIIKKLIEKKTSWKVREAEDGMKGLAQVVEQFPDLIILDIMMPTMDGYEFLQHLRADPRTNGLPVVILSSLDQVDNEIKGLQCGADDYVTKPINLNLLILRIEKLLRLSKFDPNISFPSDVETDESGYNRDSASTIRLI
jgi:type IV pilus assembly protein PilB